MITINEMKNMMIYKKRQFYAPICEKDNKHGSLIYLLTTRRESSINLIRNNMMINRHYFESVYIEKNDLYYINESGYLINADEIPYNVINEDSKALLSDPTRFVQEVDLGDFSVEPEQQILNEQNEMESEFKDTKVISEGYCNLNGFEIRNIKDVISEKADFYCKKHNENPDEIFTEKGEINDSIYSDYFDENSLFCIKPNSIHEFRLNSFKKDNKIYTGLLLIESSSITKAWFMYKNELVDISEFVLPVIVTKTVINEQETKKTTPSKKLKSTKKAIVLDNVQQGMINENCTRTGDLLVLFEDSIESIDENSSVIINNKIRKLLYNSRYKNNKEIFAAYDFIKSELHDIKYAYIDMKRYKGRNLFVDMSKILRVFTNNNKIINDRGVNFYLEFVSRLLNDSRYDENGYIKRTAFIRLREFAPNGDEMDYKKNINLISIIIRLMKTNINILKNTFSNIDFVFFAQDSYIKLNLSECNNKSYIKFKMQLEKLYKNEPVAQEPDKDESDGSIINNISDELSNNAKINVFNLTGGKSDITKKELQEKIKKAAATSNNTDEAINKLDLSPDSSKIKNMIRELRDEESNIQINAARASRFNKLEKEFLNKKIKNKSVRELLNTDSSVEELPETSLDIDSIDEGWNHLQFVNFNKIYDIDSDLTKIFNCFKDKSVPVVVRNIEVLKSSTSEDYVETWSVDYEDVNGVRFNVKLDIPKLINDRFMILRGNKKTINGQEVLLPISKTDDDTVQIVSNYNKIFISRYGSSTPGKSYKDADFIIKGINKYGDNKDFKIKYGDNSEICKTFELPIDYIDLASYFNKIETKNYIFYFNQDQIRNEYNIPLNKSDDVPYGYDKKNKKVLWLNDKESSTISGRILAMLSSESDEFLTITKRLKPSVKYCYSKASILNTEIPLIVVMGYTKGLISAMDAANIEYEIVDKKPNSEGIFDIWDYIKFKDGYIRYIVNESSSMLMNGLKECNTTDWSIGEVNGKAMWLDFLTLYGTRILSDGLDNFNDLMIDPITAEVIDALKLPDNYIDLCAYANVLLTDNKYIDHTTLDSNRYRRNELIAAYTYKALSEAYGQYHNSIKQGKRAIMSLKQSRVIDLILLDPTASDASILNPLLEAENINAVSFKGLSGMNSDRSYGLDKRTFSDSMTNVLSMSTGFAGNVGITRQATVDMQIVGKRGFLKKSKNSKADMCTTKTFGITETVIPYAVTHDDPFRWAMGFIQNSKHSMRTKISCPQLITTGGDQALPYMITDTFAFKAKQDGKIVEKTDKYMIVNYKDGTNEFIDLRDNVKKNSSSGFYTSVALKTDKKVGNKVKAGEIIAQDRYSFSNSVGPNQRTTYNSGILANVALINTDEGFEDSGVASLWLSEAATSYVITEKDVNLSKNTNVLEIVKKGQHVEEGDILLMYQTAYDDEDVNILLKTLAKNRDDVTELGKTPIRSKHTGIIKDIKIFRTVEKNELSPSLRKIVNSIEKESDDLSNVANKYDIEYIEGLNANYKLDQTGKVKNLSEGVRIEFYLEYEDKLSIGDKIILSTANKMTTKYIFPEGLEPYADSDPKNKIDAYGSIGGTSARMVNSIENTMALNKVIYYWDDRIKQKVGIKNKSLHEKIESINNR